MPAVSETESQGMRSLMKGKTQTEGPNKLQLVQLMSVISVALLVRAWKIVLRFPRTFSCCLELLFHIFACCSFRLVPCCPFSNKKSTKSSLNPSESDPESILLKTASYFWVIRAADGDNKKNRLIYLDVSWTSASDLRVARSSQPVQRGEPGARRRGACRFWTALLTKLQIAAHDCPEMHEITICSRTMPQLSEHFKPHFKPSAVCFHATHEKCLRICLTKKRFQSAKMCSAAESRNALFAIVRYKCNCIYCVEKGSRPPLTFDLAGKKYRGSGVPRVHCAAFPWGSLSQIAPLIELYYVQLLWNISIQTGRSTKISFFFLAAWNIISYMNMAGYCQFMLCLIVRPFLCGEEIWQNVFDHISTAAPLRLILSTIPTLSDSILLTFCAVNLHGQNELLLLLPLASKIVQENSFPSAIHLKKRLRNCGFLQNGSFLTLQDSANPAREVFMSKQRLQSQVEASFSLPVMKRVHEYFSQRNSTVKAYLCVQTGNLRDYWR